MFLTSSLIVLLNKKDADGNKKFSTGMAILYSLISAVILPIIFVFAGPELMSLL
jgi:hypothetical protein